MRKLEQELDRLRRASARADDVESLAKRLGRTKFNRGKEPVWVNDEFPELFPVAIPHHGGRDLSPGTKRNILDALETDIEAWRERLDVNGESGDDDADGDGD